MEINRKTEIKLQQTKRLVVHLPETEEIIACPFCEGDEVMMAAESAASVFGFSRRRIYRMVEAGMVHFLETKQGILLVCQRSLDSDLAVEKEGENLG